MSRDPDLCSSMVVAALLAAAADERAWPEAAARLALELEAEGLVIVCRDLTSNSLEVVAVHGLDLEVVRAALAGAASEGAGEPGADTWNQLPVGRLAPLARVEPWHGLVGLLGAGREAGMVVRCAPCDLVLWLLRGAQDAPFAAEDERQAQAIVAPLALALTASRRVRLAEGEARQLRHAFDRVAVGVLVSAPGGVVLLANRAAHRILERGDGLWQAGGRLRAREDAAAERLREALEPVPGRSAAAIRVPRLPGCPDLELLVAPVEPQAGGGPHDASAVVFLVDPADKALGIEEHLAALYGLTPAEARIVARLLVGSSLTDAARDLGVSRNTAHSQLAAVFVKVGATSQTDLIRRLLRGPFGAHREPTDAHRPIKG